MLEEISFKLMLSVPWQVDNPIGACGTVQRHTEREIPTFPSFKERGDTMENRRCHRSFIDNQCNRMETMMTKVRSLYSKQLASLYNFWWSC